MGIFALVLAILGGLCGVAGILTAIPVDPMPVAEFDALAWFALSGVLFLAAITCLLAPGRSE
jgi:hypothetical protein